ncbi:transposase, partial [Microcoleus sp.]|uniref:transposase n=1 Tax=Microcoleus sp. TaxID=44472 RepID=UPI0035246C23
PPAHCSKLRFEIVNKWNPRLTRLSSHTNRSGMVWGFPSVKLKKLPSLWTSSYFVSTAGNISREVVKKYIEDPHHSAN